MTILNVFKHPRRFAASAVLGVSFLAVGPTVLLSDAAQAATVSPAHVSQQAVSNHTSPPSPSTPSTAPDPPASPSTAPDPPASSPTAPDPPAAEPDFHVRVQAPPPDSARAEPDVHVHAEPHSVAGHAGAQPLGHDPGGGCALPTRSLPP